jgi:hypothetical protein
VKKVRKKIKPARPLHNRPRQQPKIPKSKYAIIEHILDFQDIYWKYPQEGFPDVLGFPLEDFVKAIREEPKLLYEEKYILDYRPELIYQGHSLVKVIIDKLQLVFSKVSSDPNSIRRAIEAKGWIEQFFDAAKHGITHRLVFPGGKPRKTRNTIKQEYDALCVRLTNFFLRGFKDFVQVNKKFIKLNFDDKNFQLLIRF